MAIFIKFPGAEMALIWLSGPIVPFPGLVPGAWHAIALRALFWPLCVSMIPGGNIRNA